MPLPGTQKVWALEGGVGGVRGEGGRGGEKGNGWEWKEKGGGGGRREEEGNKDEGKAEIRGRAIIT